MLEDFFICNTKAINIIASQETGSLILKVKLKKGCSKHPPNI